ncbi:MAG: UDP-3-O-(3-hydroxymyristoyl)glucosamine N-acyltransferase [Bacteroidetes bacterium]|nr:UDP-3-O-(3-hydroxymyristoyl)glucosamine N-acyltransferase [Bacteroidota bacterium]
MPVLKEIISSIEIQKFIGDENMEANQLVELKNFSNVPHALTWSNDKNLFKAASLEQGSIICSPKILDYPLSGSCNYIIVENPRKAFRDILMKFFYPERKKDFISPSSVIDVSAKLGNNLFIGHHVIIEENCVIGNNVSIGHNSVILANTIIEDEVKIGSNNTIGGVGFGYEKDEQGSYALMPHIGNVVIKRNAEIGNNTCIDRAVLGSTIINENAKIDNLVHIAHGVIIGKNSLIIANAMIGGSTEVGENVWMAPSSSVINGIKIGNDSTIGMGAVVIKAVEENDVVVGNPAKKLNKQ